MATERTLSIIKPDAVSKNIVGKIISRFEDNGLHIVAGKLIQLDDKMASGSVSYTHLTLPTICSV